LGSNGVSQFEDSTARCRIRPVVRVIVHVDNDRREREDVTMRYFVLLAGYGELPLWDDLTPEEQQAGMERHDAFDHACRERDGVEIIAGEALGDGGTATTMRTSRAGDVTITDGPFAEAAEHVGGFYLLDAPDLDTVIELCGILPAYDIEIRPVLSLG
jgi:hypothetical protein